MNAGTTVGASSPVASSGQDIDSTMAQKVMNDTRALMRTIAQNRGRNIETAERFVTDAESITAEEALASQVIDLVVPNADRLFSALADYEFRSEEHTSELQSRGHLVC